MIEQTISIERIEDVIDIFGSFDENIKLIEHELDVSVVSRDDQLKISGEAENVLYAVKAVQGLLGLAGRKETITEQNVRYIINLVKAGNEEHINDIARDVLCVTAKGKPIKPKTLGQKRYVDAIKKNTITLGIGPAGTGKTYLAVAAAVAAFRDKQVNRIILTRPAVEAGERLGFLPGDLQSKVDPYLRPLYDALFDMLGAETYNKYLERGSIEVAPLAYMRGRTLDDSFIILDEAQNTSREQMKMFLTRLGFGSKIVITGANGIGKTTLLKSILGLIDPLSGSVEQGDYLEIGYFEQEMSQDISTTCIEEIWKEFPGYSQYEVRSALAKCGLTTKHIESLVKVLSGGEQAKVRLCKLINRPSNVLVLDEPTNHLDVDAKDELKRALIAYRGSILMVCHEPEFYDGLADTVWDASKWTTRTV